LIKRASVGLSRIPKFGYNTMSPWEGPGQMPPKFSEFLRELADEADKLGYIGGGVIYFGGHSYTAGVGKEHELTDPFEVTRTIAFRLEADCNSIAMQHGTKSGPNTGKVS
jgi:hypothetical protein